MPKKLTQEEFIKRTIEKHGDKYDYSEVVYIGSNKKVKIYCKACKCYFWQVPYSHLLGTGCLKCGRKNLKGKTGKPLNTISFIEKAVKIHGNKYDYSYVKYTDAKKPVNIHCNKCNYNFKQTPNNHLKGEGCPNCYGNARKGKVGFIEKAKKVHGDKYDYSEVEYKNNRVPVKIRCNKCGNYFYQNTGNHLRGQGCPYCVISKGEESIANFLKFNKISYIQQRKFVGCKDKTYLPFDFYLPDYNVCIEFQGKQHYEEGFYFHLSYNKNDIEKATKQFKTITKHDQIKRDFCKRNNIALLEIRYDDNIQTKLENFLKEYKNG